MELPPNTRRHSTASKHMGSRKFSVALSLAGDPRFATTMNLLETRKLAPTSVYDSHQSSAGISPTGSRRSSVSPRPSVRMSLSGRKPSLSPLPPGGRRTSLAPRKLSVAGSKFSSAMADQDRYSMSTETYSGVHSLGPPSATRKSGLSPDVLHSSKLSGVDGLRQADQRAPTEESAVKTKEKENTGNRLLSMLKKTLQGSQSEEKVVEHETPTLVPFGDVVGCLAVHIKNCRQFTHRLSPQQCTNLFIRISINHIVKCTKVRSLPATSNERNALIKFDEVKYFSVQVPRRQDDERNNIFLELMQSGDTEKHPLFLANAEVHLYETIQKGCFTEVLQMLHKNTLICRLEVEFMFSYGNFGYGFSHQLKPLQKIIEPSMFMNIAPPPERTDPLTNVIKPQPVEYPAFLSPDLKGTIGTSDDTHQPDKPAVRLEKLQQQPRERLVKMKQEYRNLNTWIEKAEYLRNVLTPQLDSKDSKENDIKVAPKYKPSYRYEEPEYISTFDSPLTSYRAETTSEEELMLVKSESSYQPTKNRSFYSAVTQLLENEDMKNRIVPILKMSEKNSSVSIAYSSKESSPTESPLPHIHKLKVREEHKTPHSYKQDPEVVPLEKRKSVLFQSEDKLVQKHPSILKTSSSQHQDSSQKKDRSPHFSDVLIIPIKPLWYENSNKKEKPVSFPPKKYTPPTFIPEYIKFKPKHQFQKISKSGLDPFLRNINGKMSFRKKKDQNIYKYSKILSAEGVEHEDQDPPYPERLKATGPVNVTWAGDPNLVTIQMLDMKNESSANPAVNTAKASESSRGTDPTITTKTSDTKNKSLLVPSITRTKTSDTNTNNKLSRDPSNTRTKTSASKNKIPHDTSITGTKTADAKKQLDPDPNIPMRPSNVQNTLRNTQPIVSEPNFQRDSSLTSNVNPYRPSQSLDFTSDIENLKQSMLLKSILSKNLQDLSDQLFSRPEVYMNMETTKKDSSSLTSIHDKPSSSVGDKVFERIQDLNSWLPAKDILNSQTLLSQIIKKVTSDLLPESEPEKSPEEEGGSSQKHLRVDEMNFPMNKKSSFKKKHLISKTGLNGSAHDYLIKQIFTAPIFSQLLVGMKDLSEAQMTLQGQLSTPQEKNASLDNPNYGDSNDDAQLPRPKSVISQIIQSFPVDALLSSGIIKVIELEKEYQSSLLDSETASPENETKNATTDYSAAKIETQPSSGENIAIIPQKNTSVGRVEFIDSSPNISLQNSKYSIPAKEPDLPSQGQRLDREENELGSTLDNLSNSLLGKLNESDATLVKSFLKNIFNIFFKYNQSEKRQQPEKELERLIQQPLPSGTERFEEIQGSFSKVDKLDKKNILGPKLRVFLEELSDSEVKNLKSELSKHIQHYLLERLSESGHITKEDLPKIHQNLYLMNEKTEVKEQKKFQEKYSETVKEIMSFVSNFNHHFIDKHLEIKLRSFLNEILQNYFLKNLSESSFFSETEAVTMQSNTSSLRTRSASLSFNGLEQDISRGKFGRRLEINMKYPLNKPLQKYLRALSGNQLLNLKTDLSKYLQNLFMEKLAKLGLMTERQLKGISQRINMLSSSSTAIPLKYIKTDLCFRDENYFIREPSEEQNAVSKIDQDTTLPKAPEAKCRETEPTRKEEIGNPFFNNLEDNSSTSCEQEDDYSGEGIAPNLIKAQSSSNKHFQAIPFNKSPERPTDVVLKRHKKEHGVIQVPQVENSAYTTEIQDPYSCDGQAKITQPQACFERTLKVKSLEKGENINVHKLFPQEKPEAGSLPFPRIPSCKMSREDEDLCCRHTFPTWQTNTLMRVNSDSEELSKLDQYCQRLRGNNNNNKKHLVTFSQFKNETETHYTNPYENCNEKYDRVHELQSLKYKEDEKKSRPFFFPEVLKRENIKPKTRKERDHATKPKKSFHKIVRLLPATLPTTRTHLRKSSPRTGLHWTARRTIHDCFDKFEDLHVPSIKCPKKSKSRARFLGKSPDNSHNQAKHCSRPYTAPEPNKRRESASGKFASPRMVSAGLVHANDSNDYEMCKTQPKKS